MPTVFVTGATGFIGTRLVQELVHRGHLVHALTRRENPQPPPGFSSKERPDFQHSNVRLMLGDVTDIESLRRGMAGCSQVYHLAGYAKNWARDPQTYTNINVNGLRNACQVAGELGIDRIVWTSTMLTFGPSRSGQLVDERTRRTTTEAITLYEVSKTAGEQVAAEFVARGQQVVTVNPTRVFGPGHFHEGNATSLVIDMYDRGKAPFLAGGNNIGNWVFIDDVVQGLILAMERGQAGEKYLLSGENLTLKQFFTLVDKVTGKRHFQITIRRPAAMTYAWLLKKCAEWFGTYPQITPDWVRVFLTDWACTSAKAHRELGYHITPIEEAVRRTYEWILQVRAERQRGSKICNQ